MQKDSYSNARGRVGCSSAIRLVARVQAATPQAFDLNWVVVPGPKQDPVQIESAASTASAAVAGALPPRELRVVLGYGPHLFHCVCVARHCGAGAHSAVDLTCVCSCELSSAPSSLSFPSSQLHSSFSMLCLFRSPSALRRLQVASLIRVHSTAAPRLAAAPTSLLSSAMLSAALPNCCTSVRDFGTLGKRACTVASAHSVLPHLKWTPLLQHQLRHAHSQRASDRTPPLPEQRPPEKQAAPATESSSQRSSDQSDRSSESISEPRSQRPLLDTSVNFFAALPGILCGACLFFLLLKYCTPVRDFYDMHAPHFMRDLRAYWPTFLPAMSQKALDKLSADSQEARLFCADAGASNHINETYSSPSCRRKITTLLVPGSVSRAYSW
jgi:hypothetical protein